MAAIRDMAMAMAVQTHETSTQRLRMKWAGRAATLLAWFSGALGLSGVAVAQTNAVGLPAVGQVGAGLRAASEPALAVGQSILVPGVRGNLLLSNNLDLRPDGLQTGHWLIEAAPYLDYRAVTTRGPVQLYGALRSQFRQGSTDSFRVRGELRGSTSINLIDDWLQVFARGSVQTVNLDPFRASSADPGSQSGNTGSLRDFEISPAVSRPLEGDGSWNAAYRIRSIDLGQATQLASIYGGSNVQQTVQAGIKTDLSRRMLGLSAEARSTWTDYRNGLDYKNAEADLLGWLRIGPALRVGAGWGWSSNDRLINTTGQDQGSGAVAAVEWTPTPRTLLKARWADRYSGDQISASADHRFGLWNFGLAYGQGVQDGNLSNLYGLLRQQQALSPSPTASAPPSGGVVAGLESSPAAVVASTINPALQFAGLLPSPLVYFEQGTATARIVGARTAIQAALFFNDRRSAINLGGLGITDLNQRGLSLAASYQLDGIQTLNLGMRYTLTDSDSNASEARLSTLIGSWDVRLRPRWIGSLGARLQKQTGSGVTVQFDEAALFIATDYRFQ